MADEKGEHYIPGADTQSRWGELECSDGCRYRYFYDSRLNRSDALSKSQWNGMPAITSLHAVYMHIARVRYSPLSLSLSLLSLTLS
jgi:hypothetical protein